MKSNQFMEVPNELVSLFRELIAKHQAKVWDLATGKQLVSVNLDAGITCCAITPDGQTIVAGDASGGVHFLRLVNVIIV